jgi:hypothetical protein
MPSSSMFSIISLSDTQFPILVCPLSNFIGAETKSDSASEMAIQTMR